MRQLNGAVIAARAAQLRDKGVAALLRHLAGAAGRRIEVLMESEGAAARLTSPRFGSRPVRPAPGWSTPWSRAMTAAP